MMPAQFYLAMNLVTLALSTSTLARTESMLWILLSIGTVVIGAWGVAIWLPRVIWMLRR